MERKRIVHPDNVSTLLPLYAGIAQLASPMRYRIIELLARSDPDPSASERYLLAVRNFQLARDLVVERSPQEWATLYCSYRERALIDYLFLLTSQGEMSSLLRSDGWEPVQQLANAGTPIVLVPIHSRDYLFAVPALAHLGIPVTVLGATRDKPSAVIELWPGLDIDRVHAEDPMSLVLAVRSARKGRAIVYFPDVYFGKGSPNVPVEMMGATFLASRGISLTCRTAGAVAVPIELRGSGTGNYVMHFGDPIAPPSSRKADAEHLRSLFRAHEQLLRDEPHAWIGWSVARWIMRAASG